MSFRFVPKSVSLNDLEWRNTLILHYFTEFANFMGILCKSRRQSHNYGQFTITTSSSKRLPLIYFRFLSETAGRPHFRAICKVLWKMVKNCICNRSRSDEIESETEICTSLKSEFYFRCHWPPSIKSTLISYISIQVLWRFVRKSVHHNWETAKIGFCTPLIYFRFVSKTIAFERTTFLSGMQNLLKIGKELRT